MNTTSINASTRELLVAKTLNAPIEVVWEVWTNPDHIASWWGPAGFTNTIHKMDVVADGEWRLTMHGPDGKRFPNKSVFKEITALKKIVFQHFNPNYLATIMFEPGGNQTWMEWSMLFDTNELFETVVKVFKADEGLKQSVEKLETYLQQVK